MLCEHDYMAMIKHNEKEDDVAYYQLTWDAKTSKYQDCPERLAVLLCNEPFNVKWIGRPIESTIVFWMVRADDDVDQLYTSIKKKFPSGFDFILSRVSRAKIANKDKDFIRGAGIKAHEDGFGDVLKKLYDEKKIIQGVTNLKVNF